MDRRKFLRGTLMGGIAVTLSGCGGGGGGGSASGITPADTGVTPAPSPAATPAPPPPPVPTLNGITIDQAEADIAGLFTQDLAWRDRPRSYQNEIVVRSPAELQTAANTLFDTQANAQVGAINHRIVCAWDGVASLPGPPNSRVTIGKVYSTLSHFDSGGSITVAAATGYRPALGNTLYILAQGVIVEGLAFTRSTGDGELPTATAGVLIVNGGAAPLEPIVHFKNCYFGNAAGLDGAADFSSKATAPDATKLANGVSTQGLSRFISFADCKFWGTTNCAKIVSRGLRMDGCDFSAMVVDGLDLFGHAFASGYTAAAWISRCTFRDAIDRYENRSDHIDAIQYCGPMDIHEGIRLLVTDTLVHLSHSFAGDPGLGGGTQGMHGGGNYGHDNQFVLRRCAFMTTAPHGFSYFSPRASRPSFVDRSTFFRAGRTPSGFAPDTQPQQDFVVGITGAERNAPATGNWLLVTGSISANLYTSNGAVIETVPVDPRNIAANDRRPETVFVGRDFRRSGAAVNNMAGKFGYDLPNEKNSQAAFAADMWANFAGAPAHHGKGMPDPRGVRWKG